MRMEDDRFPKHVLLGTTMVGGRGSRGGQGSGGVFHLGEDLVVFGIKDEKEGGGKWKETAQEQQKWYGKIEDGMARFMRKWHIREAGASAKRRLAREAGAASRVWPLLGLRG